MVSAIPIVSFGCLIWGAFVPSFQFTIHGVAGIVQNFGRANSSVVDYSLFSVATRLLQQSSHSTTTTSFVGIRYIAALYIIKYMYINKNKDE